MALSTKAVTVFATLEALRDDQPDIRYPLATLFEPDLAKFNDRILDTNALADEINAQYHLGITKDVVEGFIPIFEKRGWLREIINNENLTAYVVECPQTPQVPTELASFQRAATKLAADFRSFIDKISPLSQFQKSDSDLIDSLVDFLLLLDQAGGASKPVGTHYRVGNRLVLEVIDTSDGGAPSEDIFLSARFVQHLFDTDSPHVGFLLELSEVGLVTEVVRDFQKPSSAVQKTDLAIYLDAPVAMDYLGLSGLDLQNGAVQLFSRFRHAGGSIRIFRESIVEMQSSLHALLMRPQNERTGPTADALRRREVLEQFVREIYARPDSYIKQKGIAIVEDTLESFPNSHKYFTRDAYEVLYSQIGWVKEDVARHHDALIAALACRRRAGVRTPDIFEAKHVVLTKNPFYPQLARRIAKDQGYITSSHVGPVLHMRELATAVWLRMGSHSKSDIPRSYILSACRRILTLRKNIVEKVNEFKTNLSATQAEQLEILMASDRSTQVLMDKTLGLSSVIDERNILVLLEEMKKAQIEEFTAKRDEEEAQREELAKQQQERLASEAQNERFRAEKAEQDASEQSKKLQSVHCRIVEETNRRIARSRLTFISFWTFVVAVSTVVGFYAQGINLISSAFILAILVVIACATYFVSAIHSWIVDPWFAKRDLLKLNETAAEFAIDVEELLPKVRYEGYKFVLQEH